MESKPESDGVVIGAIIGKDEKTIAAQPRAGSGVVLPGNTTESVLLAAIDASGETTHAPSASAADKHNENDESHANNAETPKQFRGHRRQRSASWSEADARQFLANLTPPPVSTSSDAETIPTVPVPLFMGMAPQSPKLSGHSYTPRKPVLRTSSKMNEAREVKPAKCDVRVENTLQRDSSLEDPNAEHALEDGIMLERIKAMEFYKKVTCYEMMPESGKIVVLETRLHVKKAFNALLTNGIRAALLWDSATQQYVGMITITDFIKILRKYYVSPLVAIEELEDHRIQTWRDIAATDGHLRSTLICIDPNATLYDAARTIQQESIHRLPVIDTPTGNALQILTLSKMINYMKIYFPWDQCPLLLKQTLRDLDLGTTKNVAAVSEDTPLISVLNIFVTKHISALPVIDSEGQVLDVYVKHDAINLARDRTYNDLDVPVSVALKARRIAANMCERKQTCFWDDTLGSVLDQIFENDLHRMIIVNDKQQLIGVISLSDIMALFVF
eukprot:m.403040 g.403040  ORF g.403040 m.403040 type:complete len:502 (-) comp21190_c0_seq2:539-2044(-)